MLLPGDIESGVKYYISIENLKVYLKKLELKNYRNYNHINLDFERNTVLLVGNNGNGKTNLLESIYYLSSGKSHRTSIQDDLINWDADFCLIRAEIGSGKEDQSCDNSLVEIEIRRQNRVKIRINRVYLKKKSDFTSLLPSVIFSPDDLRIVKSSPSQRRDFLDSLLEKIQKDYYHLRLQYNKVLFQRNGLIKSISGKVTPNHAATLEAWNDNLVKYGVEIMKNRIELINRLKEKFSRQIRDFFNNTGIEIAYIFSWERQDSNDRYDMVNEKKGNMDRLPDGWLRELFKSKLTGNLERDMSYKTTTTGPHRDDFTIFFNGKDIRSFGSQGQQRIASVSLKLCELQILKEDLGKDPVLLLDDVLSELDINRRKKLVRVINDCFQTFVTATNVSYFNNLDIDFNSKYLIKNNEVTILDY